MGAGSASGCNRPGYAAGGPGWIQREQMGFHNKYYSIDVEHLRDSFTLVFLYERVFIVVKICFLF